MISLHGSVIFVESINVFAPNSTIFVSSSSFESLVSEVVKPLEVTPPRKIRVELKEFKPKQSILSKDKSHDKPAWVCHFCGNSRHIHPNCYKLQAAKKANKPKVLVPQYKIPWYSLMNW